MTIICRRGLLIVFVTSSPTRRNVALVGLERAPDTVVWNYARTYHYAIVTKDSDFNDLSVVLGAPPKLIWLRVGNCTTTYLEQLLRRHEATITTFLNSQAAVLTLV